MTSATKFSLTVDVEGAWFDLPGEQGAFDESKIVDAVGRLEIQLFEIESVLGRKIPVTWFIRCDDSVAHALGCHEGLLSELDKFIDRRADAGDAFGLHPHLYRMVDSDWVSERDPAAQVRQIERSHRGWCRYFGSGPKLVRIGEALMNDEIAECLDTLEVSIDSSALPGRKRFDSGFQFDWSNTPETPYRPSVLDYRVPANLGAKGRSFVEVPFSMLAIKCAHDETPLNRYLNLAFHPELILDAIDRRAASEPIVAVVHPHELVDSRVEHPLISYSATSLSRNLLALEERLGCLNFVSLLNCVDAHV